MNSFNGLTLEGVGNIGGRRCIGLGLRVCVGLVGNGNTHSRIILFSFHFQIMTFWGTLPYERSGRFCSSRSFFGVLGALLHLLRLASRCFKERFRKLVHCLFEGRTEWPENSTLIRGIVAWELTIARSFNPPLVTCFCFCLIFLLVVSACFHHYNLLSARTIVHPYQ